MQKNPPIQGEAVHHRRTHNNEIPQVQGHKQQN